MSSLYLDNRDLLDGLRNKPGFPGGVIKTHPELYAMVMDRGGRLDADGIRCLGLEGVDFSAITTVDDLSYQRSQAMKRRSKQK